MKRTTEGRKLRREVREQMRLMGIKPDTCPVRWYPGERDAERAQELADVAREAANEDSGICEECKCPVSGPSDVDCLSHLGAAWQAKRDGAR